MALFEKGNNIGNRFTSENQPKKNGRKPSMYKQLKQFGFFLNAPKES